MSCVTPAQKSLLREAGYEFDDATRWLQYNVSVQSKAQAITYGDWWYGPPAGDGLAFFSDPALNYTNATQAIVPARCIYTYDQGSANAIVEWLGDYFNGTVFSAPEALFVSIDGGQTSVITGSAALLTNLYDFGNVTLSSINATFANITDSITTYIRQNSAGVLVDPAIGVATNTETCVHIRWGWLAFPAALAILMLVFFVALVHGTRRCGLEASNHDFKSDLLPLLFRGLYDDKQEDMRNGAMGTMAQMERDARSMLVELGLTERGWRLVEVGTHKTRL